jgi:hypothetical protein
MANRMGLATVTRLRQPLDVEAETPLDRPVSEN